MEPALVMAPAMPMLANVFTKGVRDASPWTLAAAVVLIVLAGVALPIYADFGDTYLELLDDMPAWMSVVFGEGVTSVAGLVTTAMFALMTPLVLIVYAVAMGTAAAVGEEEGGTLGLLLANPISRTRVLVTKTVVAVTGIVVIALLVWLGITTIAAIVGIDLSGQDTAAASVHLTALALLYGALALAVSAWTGSSTLGLGTTGVVAVVSYVTWTWLPMAPDLADLARLSPWHLYGGADALRSGVDAGLLGLALLLSGGLFVIGAVGLRRRDLRG
jgi:ABC-2 type transport system permease protein